MVNTLRNGTRFTQRKSWQTIDENTPKMQF